MEPLPTLDGVLNFRDMGGLVGQGGTISHRRLFRSGHLATATDSDVETLADLGITMVIDFRLESDKQGDGGADRVPAGVDLVKLPVVDPSGEVSKLRELLMSGDQDRLEAEFGDGRALTKAREGAVAQATEPLKQEVYGTFLRLVADAEGPLVFHCSAGKDRAGWAATLIGMALGVGDDELMEHYLLSNVHRPVQQRLDYYASLGHDVELMRPFLQVDASYLTATLHAVDTDWASRETYLEQALGFDGGDVESLRAKYLE